MLCILMHLKLKLLLKEEKNHESKGTSLLGNTQNEGLKCLYERSRLYCIKAEGRATVSPACVEG